MTLHFSVNYHTEPGQDVYVLGSIKELGGGDVHRASEMVFSEGWQWKKDVALKVTEDVTFEYRYFIKGADGFAFYEAGYPRKITITSKTRTLWLKDQWQGYTDQAPLLTAPFSDVMFPHGTYKATEIQKYDREVVVKVTVPAIPEGEGVYLCGDAPAMGSWNPAEAVEMVPVQGSRWEAHLDARILPQAISFKFLKGAFGKKVDVIWEEGENRTLELPTVKDAESFSVEYAAAAFPEVYPRMKGTAVPVFSLRSETSEGIGDFVDLRMMADWAASTGQHIIQLLPINDTTANHSWTDSYPYSGISVMALHPLYLKLSELGELKDKKAAAAFEKERKALNSLPDLDYVGVLRFKEKYFSLYFDQMGKETFASADYKRFYGNNEYWLPSYALFCALRDKFGTADFSKWGKYAKYRKSFLKDIPSSDKDVAKAVDIACFLQYHADRQFKTTVEYAHRKGVALKGDIPIGITPYSVGGWAMPELFNMEACAGAPPDFFSADGQNWGFPTYNWDAMAKDGFMWWKTRFAKMADYFDAYRIDHVLGFFRIWEIPRCQVSGTMGHFAPALPMSPQEIHNYGFPFDEKRHTLPYIKTESIRKQFDKDADEILKKYFRKAGNGITLKSEYDTQKKIGRAFEWSGEPLMKYLTAMVQNVLFVEDPYQKGFWHPVISAQGTESYQALNDDEKRAYDAIYNDFFFHRHNDFWKAKAYTKLPELIASAPMLTCAEDLGMIPDCVPEVMSSLRILTLEIQRMPKGWGRRFSYPPANPYLSVGSTGSHDISTLRGWWEEDRDGAACYWYDILHQEGPVPEHLEPEICEEIVRRNLEGNSMLTIIPLQDYLGMDSHLCPKDAATERINDPANARHHWKYRMFITLEQLCREKKLNEKIREMMD